METKVLNLHAHQLGKIADEMSQSVEIVEQSISAIEDRIKSIQEEIDNALVSPDEMFAKENLLGVLEDIRGQLIEQALQSFSNQKSLSDTITFNVQLGGPSNNPPTPPNTPPSAPALQIPTANDNRMTPVAAAA